MKSRQTPQIDLDDWEILPASYFFTVQEVTDILRHKTRKSVDTAIKNGTLQAINVGGQQRETSRPANGRLFKHIKPTWLQEPSPPKAGQSGRSDGRNARSSRHSSGPGGWRSFPGDHRLPLIRLVRNEKTHD